LRETKENNHDYTFRQKLPLAIANDVRLIVIIIICHTIYILSYGIYYSKCWLQLRSSPAFLSTCTERFGVLSFSTPKSIDRKKQWKKQAKGGIKIEKEGTQFS
jgi:hypothetical protein